MTQATELFERPTVKAPGRLNKALLRLLMKRATVVAVEQPTDQFRLVTLEDPALKNFVWTPGQKIQIAMGSAFVSRTYTPMDWDAGAGRTRILGYAHGDGPGSAWLHDIKPGDACDIFGPRTSLDVSRVAGPLAVFGDETSIGLAHALAKQDPSRSCTHYFEVRDPEDTKKVVTGLELDGAKLFATREGDAHLADMEASLAPLIAAGTAFVLTGKAGTIQRLRQYLKRAAPAASIFSKAYWAPGKTGLD